MSALRRGFTLIEIVAVMLLLGILAGIVMFSVRGHLQHARLVQTADRLESLDRRARDEARRRTQPGQIVWDTRQGVARIDFAQSSGRKDSTRRVRLAGGLEFTRVLISGGRGTGAQRVDISPIGQSATYAVRLTAPNGAAMWLVTLGLSGQHLRLESEEEVRALLTL